MIIRGMQHVGFDTTYFFSARKGGLSTAIDLEAGVPEHILWSSGCRAATPRM
jgi:hypothetical protein